MLHTPRYRGSRRELCGPTAIAAVTGADMNDIRDALRQASGNIIRADGAAHPVMGVNPKHLVAAMAHLGWRTVDQCDSTDNHVNRRDIFRLGDFLDHCGHSGPFIVNVTGHYHAVSHGDICDTFSCLPMDIAKFKKRGQWVKRWWKFAPMESEQ